MLAAGWSDDEVRRLLRLGDLSRVRRGSYVVGPLPDEPARRHRIAITAAAAALCEGAVVSHASAVVLHGLPLWGVGLDRVHVTRARASGGRRGRIVHVHTAPLGADEIALVDGIAVASVARTVIDVARTVPFEQAVVVLDAALALGMVDGEQLAEALLRARGWPGCPAARRAVAFAEPGAQSVGESRSRVAIQRAGLPPPILQWEVCDAAGRRLGFVDFGWPRLRLVGEFDGEIKYGRLLEPGQSAGDVVFAEKVREDLMRATDLGMARWIWDELGTAFAPVAARIRRLFRPR
ncbi:MAG TPA: hypothetical protein VGE11_12715 [Pseudonocardia sp.]